MRRTSSRLLALTGTLFVLAVTVLAALVLSGRVHLVVTHGVSMNPLYYQGDLVVIESQPHYRVGEVVAYRRDGHSDLVLHRIIGGTAQGYAFKGDNNQSPDPTKPDAAHLVGRALFHVPQGGTWLKRLTTPPVVAVLIVLVLSGGSHHQQRRRRRTVSRHASPSRRRTAVTGLPAGSAALSLLLVVLVLATAGLALVAWTRPVGHAQTAPAGTALRTAFSYRADVGQSAAYDGTTATSPDPVFLTRARRITVGLDHTGPAGTISATAEVSAGSGWHTTVPVLRATPFHGTRFRATAPLDLDAMLAKASRAAAATGVPTSPLTVTLAARITSPGRADHEPTLALELTPQELRLADGPSSLVVTESGAGRASQQVTDVVAVGPLRAQVRTVREASLVALAVLLGLVWLAWSSRAAREPDTDRVKRRHAGSFVTIAPSTVEEGPQVIDVTALSTLVQLAERYDTVVLTWSEGRAETFLVHFDSVTYRFRRTGGSGQRVGTLAQ